MISPRVVLQVHIHFQEDLHQVKMMQPLIKPLDAMLQLKCKTQQYLCGRQVRRVLLNIGIIILIRGSLIIFQGIARMFHVPHVI
ncbi:MAG: hypothetical protein CVV36_02510 [Candidatus Methanoperedenaceae archaeon HGW-Methanoperedenaceae-1]|nr:MAG: hypothetical protein CVV36_02510 [Candidatus Methanoperedenaceae archaeon HGW-Methanoperedenaceae-1]